MVDAKIPGPRNKRWSSVVHAFRVMVVCGLLALIPSARQTMSTDGMLPPHLDLSRIALPRVVSVAPEADSEGMWSLLDKDGASLGKLARTLPAAKSAIGYRGPSEAGIIFDQQLNVVDVQWLNSADTPEHVEAVKKNADFFKQFRKWQWGGPSSDVTIDGVSGATLTSLAFAKGIILRIGGERPSLVFPDTLQKSELKPWIPGSVTVDTTRNEAVVRDEQGQVTGRVIRTGVLSDDLSGYQGPTELLVYLSPDDKILDLRIRKSFDNEPYVDYVRTERSFWKTFKGKTIGELSQFDPVAAGVDGVSGATMTSVNLAHTLVASAKMAIARAAQPKKVDVSWWQSIRWSSGEMVAVGFLFALLACSRSGFFRSKYRRTLWLVGVVAFLGIGTGNLVSMALVAGWSAEGVAWTLAPGLFAIVVITFMIPPVTKGNPYCNHLCPHGAMQQLIKPARGSRRHVTLPPWLASALTCVPGVLLSAAYMLLVSKPSTDLSTWEPFHAYLFRIAGWGSIALAVASLVIAFMIPMAYCRMGCSTGRLIEYLRRSANSHRIEMADWVAASLLVFAVWSRWV
jgi:NosR/NirI family transcriptional regulator, nitrous oxide reductase regulator